MTSPKKSQNRTNSFIPSKPETFQIIAFVLCLTIFLFGVWLGSIDLNPNSININSGEKFKVIFPIAVQIIPTTLFLLFINVYVKEHIDFSKEEYERKTRDFKQELKDTYREKLELDILSMILEDSGTLNQIFFSLEDFSDYIKDLHNDFKLEKVLIEYIKESNDRRVALEGLNNGFTKNKDSIYPFSPLIVDACNYALGIHDNKSHQWIEPFYIDIRTFLKAWLICSIRYGVDIPIGLSYQKSLGKEGKLRYHGKATYVKAIRYLQEITLENEAIGDYFTTTGSREIVSKYLDKLVSLLELEKNSVSST